MASPANHAQADLATAHVSPTLYFPSAADEASSRMALHARIAPEVAAIASVSDGSLVRELDHCEALPSTLQTHAAFLKLQTLEDTQDQAAKKARDEVDTDQSILEAAMNSRLQRVVPIQVGSLGRYALLARNAQRDAAHAISAKGERYRGVVYVATLNSLSDDYERIDALLKRPKEATAANTATRRKALSSWNEAWDAQLQKKRCCSEVS